MGNILRVNLKTLTTTAADCPAEYALLGGRALTSAIVAAEVPPSCHPLEATNRLVFAPGLLGGSTGSTSGRLSVGGKSPLTGGIKEANSGGTAGQAMAKLGLTAIVLEDQPEDKDTLYVLKIDSSGAELTTMPELEGLGNYDTCDKLREKFGEKISCVSIGPVGEMKLSAASVAVTDMEGRPTRHAGRGGLGAVMGSKRVKAIVLDTAGCQKCAPSDPDAMKAASKKFVKLLGEHATTSETLPLYGTNALASVINAAGDYPTRNFSSGTFEGVDGISGETGREIMLSRKGVTKHPCQPGCVIGCSAIYNDENGEFLSKGPEYETVWAHGADCGIDNLDAVARMDRLDDDLGLDTIEMGATLGVAMEGGLLPFGDCDEVIRLLDEDIRNGTPLGRVLASGATVTGRVLGVSRIPCVKGQAMPAYDPRAAKGIGVTYATTPMGADHTAGYAIAVNILGVGGSVDPLKSEGQVELSRNLQIATASLDSTGLCLFVAFPLLDLPAVGEALIEMLCAYTGHDWTLAEYLAMGKKTLQAEVDFNRRAGFTTEHDRLPDFFKNEKLPPHNVVFDVPDKELDQVHAQ